MTNINPSKIILKVRTAMWYLFFQTIGIWLLSSCEQKDLCYDHNHASNVKVTFDWEQYPNANPASMCFYLFPREEGERTLKREFIGKNGGIAQALVGVSYTALGFNSDARNTSFRYNISTNSIEASSKDAGAIDRIGISASLLPRAKGTEGERMSMEADSIYSSASEKDILISLEENDRGDTCKITLSPKRRFCTYRLKIMNIDNQQNLILHCRFHLRPCWRHQPFHWRKDSGKGHHSICGWHNKRKHFGRTASMLWEQPIRGCRQLFGYIYHVKGWHKVVLHL